MELDLREEIYINFIESGRYTERLRKGSRIVDAEAMNEVDVASVKIFPRQN